jgi:signal peptidase I
MTTREGPTTKRRKRHALPVWAETVVLLVLALVVSAIVKTFFIQMFFVPSGSMRPLFVEDDRILVQKISYWNGDVHRGDVVVFDDPGGQWLGAEGAVALTRAQKLLSEVGLYPTGGHLVKRVIGVGGDHVRCCDKDGRVTVNGVPLNEPYLHPGNVPSTMPFDVRVPQGRLFVMGDHRSNSADSRFHLEEEGSGTVAEGEVVGRAVVIAWPLDHWRRLEEPETYASVPNARAGTTAAQSSSNSVSSQDQNGMVLLPTPAELPLVMGVVGLLRLRGRRFARSEEWMWGMWPSAHDPDTMSRRKGRGSSPSRPRL